MSTTGASLNGDRNGLCELVQRNFWYIYISRPKRGNRIKATAGPRDDNILQYGKLIMTTNEQRSIIGHIYNYIYKVHSLRQHRPSNGSQPITAIWSIRGYGWKIGSGVSVGAWGGVKPEVGLLVVIKIRISKNPACMPYWSLRIAGASSNIFTDSRSRINCEFYKTLVCLKIIIDADQQCF